MTTDVTCLAGIGGIHIDHLGAKYLRQFLTTPRKDRKARISHPVVDPALEVFADPFCRVVALRHPFEIQRLEHQNICRPHHSARCIQCLMLSTAPQGPEMSRQADPRLGAVLRSLHLARECPRESPGFLAILRCLSRCHKIARRHQAPPAPLFLRT